jgi:multicomponent Na+:H+ antiporter subunit B
VTRRIRMGVLGAGGAVLTVLFVLSCWRLPSFGSNVHPFRDHAVPAALSHHTSNVVSSVNYDQRGMDTLGEQTILLAAVIGVAALLRPGPKEHRRTANGPQGLILPGTMLAGYLMLPVTLIIGATVVAHGVVTPGGGFQGGVALGAGLYLLYVAGRYRSLEQLRPPRLFTALEAAGALACLSIALAGTASSLGFLGNALPTGALGNLLSGGTAALFSASIGVEVAGAIVVLVEGFLDQVIRVRPGGEPAEQDPV